MKTFSQKTLALVKAHKVITVIIALAVVFGGYYAVKAGEAGKTVTTYTLSTVATGTIITTVTGTGQVSADNDEDVAAQVSGTIDSIPVSVGQTVNAGDTLAHIDSTSAEQSLQTAQLAYDKLVEPATADDVTGDENSVSQSYANGYNSVTSAMTDLLTVKSGLYQELYDASGYASNSGQSANTIHTVQSASDDWSAANASYDDAINAYGQAYADFQDSSIHSGTSTIADLIDETHTAASEMAQAVNDTNVLVNFLATNDTDSRTAGAASDAQSDMQTWSSAIDGDVANLLSAENSIKSSETSLDTLLEGPDLLDVQSQQISVTQAQQNYDYTYVTAPFDGIVAKIDVTLDEQVTSGTTIATVVTPDEYATISLNEVDAAKVQVGQKATLTFDAINDLSIAGTVSEVDGIGTVSQGVVTYNVKITFDSNDSRVKPGMSVNAAIITADDADTLTVPSAAVKTQGNASYVQELSQKYSAAQAAAGVTSATAPHNVVVTVGLSDNTDTEILSGLSVGDQVVTKTSTTQGGGTATAARSAATTATTRGGFGGGGGGASVLRGL